MSEPLLYTSRRILIYVENLDKAISYYRDVLGFNGLVPSFQVPNIQQVIDTYKQRGVRIVQDVLEVSHGWIAFIADLEGNVIQIYQGKG